MSLWSISITDCGFVGVMWSYVVGAGGRRGCLRILQSMKSTPARPERNPNSDTQNQYLLCKVGAVALLGVALELLHLGPQLHQHFSTLVDDRRVVLARVDVGEDDQAVNRVVVGKAISRSRVADDDLSEAVDGTDAEEAKSNMRLVRLQEASVYEEHTPLVHLE